MQESRPTEPEEEAEGIVQPATDSLSQAPPETQFPAQPEAPPDTQFEAQAETPEAPQTQPAPQAQAQPEGKVIHIVANTHWDREWVYPFEETRLLLLEFMDNLLDMLEAQPEYHSFLMDSQVLCVEDYLEMRPERREQVRRLVKAGRLIIGPWYSLPEEYIVNGESLVRNLLIGIRTSLRYGAVSKIGYTPFSYGQTSQMPQIYNGFGIDTIIFYRGINTPKSEFVMEGPDGSRLLGMRFGALSRFSFYFYIYRTVRYNKTRDEWWYDWDLGALPFRLCNEFRPLAHYYVLDPSKKKWMTEWIPKMLPKLIADESEHFTTQHICCMQGFDSSEPDPDELKLIEECRKYLQGTGHQIVQDSLGRYMATIRPLVKDPYVIKGESRDPGATGKWTHLFGDVISSRTRTKRLNARNETALQRLAEPWATIGWMLSRKYPKTSLDYAWRTMLKNHPHDTICGAGIDQMEKDLVNRAEQSIIVSEGLMRRGMQEVQKRIDNSDVDVKETVLTVFNPSPFPRTEVVTAYLDLPDISGYEAFSLRDPQGKAAPMQEVVRFPQETLVRNLQDISLGLRAERVKLHFKAENVPALGYKTYHVRHEERPEPRVGNLVTGENVMENEHLVVLIRHNGTLDITHKESGHTFTGLHYLEDCGENGHSWTHMTPEFDEVITSHGVPVRIALEESGPLLARYRVDYEMNIPVGLEDTPQGKKRSEARKPLVVTSWFTLRAGAKVLEVTTRCDNQHKFHRLRVCLPTRIMAEKSAAEAAFDVIERPIIRQPGNPYYGRENPQYPMHRFVDLSDGKVGLAVINDGMREFEAMEDNDRTLAITLIRAYEFKQSPVIDRWDVHPEMPLSQAPGEHEWRYAIYPHAGDWAQSEILVEADRLNLPLELAQAGPHEGTLPKEMSFLQVEPSSVGLTAMKKAEDHDSVIVRLFNPTWEDVDVRVTCHKPVTLARLCNLNEEPLDELVPMDGAVEFTMEKKKICTLELVFA